MLEEDENAAKQPRKGTMKAHTVTPAQRATAVEEFIKGLITSSTPSAIENKYFRKAFAILGVDDLPSKRGSPACSCTVDRNCPP
jgi:hypothetical protein